MDFANHKVGRAIGRGIVAGSAWATRMYGWMCSCEGPGRVAGLVVAGGDAGGTAYGGVVAAAVVASASVAPSADAAAATVGA